MEKLLGGKMLMKLRLQSGYWQGNRDVRTTYAFNQT